MPPSSAIPDRECDVCGKLYSPPHKRSRYCSKPCLWRSKNQRRPEQKRLEYAANRRADWAANRDRYNERAKQYRDPDKLRAWRQNSFQKTRLSHPWLSLLYSARSRAKKKGLTFTLTPEWAASMWTGRCAITDIPFVLGQRGTGPKRLSPSIDRIKPHLGYTPNNCRFILHAVNALKQDGTDTEMIEIASAIIKKSRMVRQSQ